MRGDKREGLRAAGNRVGASGRERKAPGSKREAGKKTGGGQGKREKDIITSGESSDWT